MRAELLAAAAATLWTLVATAADVRLTAEPPQLQLGTQSESVVTIVGPEDLSDVSMTVNHGIVLTVNQVAPGRFAASYRAPAHTYPRVAIIDAVGTSKGARVHGWLTLPLWGSAMAQLQTAPNAVLSVRIGDRTYGPVVADARGVGQVQVVVPPGVESGFYGSKVLDLNLPPVSLTHLAFDHAGLRGDQPREQRVFFYAITGNGTPRAGLALRSRVTHGALSAFQEQAPGVYRAVWSLPASDPKDAEISVWSTSNPVASQKVRVMGGPPVKVVMAAVPARVTTGPVKLTARVTDARGFLTETSLAFTASVGTLTGPAIDGDGVWTATLVIPRSFGGASTSVVRASAGEATAQVDVVLAPGPPRALEVAPANATITRDGRQSVAFAPRLIDAEGNRIDTTIESLAQAGALTASHDYRPFRALGDGTDEVTFAAQGLTARVPVTLLGASSRLSFAIKAGFLSNLGNANGLATAVSLTAWPTSHFGIGLQAGYLFIPRDAVISDGTLAGARVRLRAHGVPLQAMAAWRGSLGRSVPVQATAAAGALIVSSRLKVVGQQEVAEVSLVPMASAAASVGYAFGGWAPFLEAQAQWAGGPEGNNLTGSLVSVGVSVGCRFELL